MVERSPGKAQVNVLIDASLADKLYTAADHLVGRKKLGLYISAALEVFLRLPPQTQRDHVADAFKSALESKPLGKAAPPARTKKRTQDR